MDSLLPLLLLVLALIWVMRARRRGGRDDDDDGDRPRDETVRSALSYRQLDGTVLEQSGLRLSEAGSGIEVESLEIVPQAGRRRLVLGVTLTAEAAAAAPAQIERALWRLAHRVQDTLAAHVVVVETTEGMRVLFAPDGRGWSGDESLVGASARQGETAHGLSLGEVHHALRDSTLDGIAAAD